MPHTLWDLPTCVSGGWEAGNFSTMPRINTPSRCQSGAHQSFRAHVIYIVLALQSQKRHQWWKSFSPFLIPLPLYVSTRKGEGEGQELRVGRHYCVMPKDSATSHNAQCEWIQSNAKSLHVAHWLFTGENRLFWCMLSLVLDCSFKKNLIYKTLKKIGLLFIIVWRIVMSKPSLLLIVLGVHYLLATLL